MNASGLLQRLRERKLGQWALAYLAGAWVLLQALDLVGQQFGWPPGLLRGITLTLAIGFFIALVLAWYHGERGLQRVSGTELMILTLLLAIGGGMLWRFGGSAALDSAAPAGSQAPPAAKVEDVSAKSIAVLPFENLSGDKENAYFVSGMQDMILTSLAKIRELKVISRTSTEKYASRPENLKKVAAELGVANLLEGSVQRIGDQVLINLQLIDARSDTHLWAESYQRKVEDVFSLEQEVATIVAEALRAKLLPSETQAIAAHPTDNPEAYDLFLRAEYAARKFQDSGENAALADAIALYQQAVATDPKFALAFARLSLARSMLYWNGGTKQLSMSDLAKAAQAAADTAKQLDPKLPDANLALADIQYRIHLDYPGALAAYEAVLEDRPGDVDALWGRGLVLRRLGRFSEAIASYDAAIKLNPRNDTVIADRALTCFFAGCLDEADAGFRKALALNADNTTAAFRLANLKLYRNGDADAALATLQGEQRTVQFARVSLLAFQRKYDQALALTRVIEADPSDAGEAAASRGMLLAAAGQREAAAPLLRKAGQELRAELASLPLNSGAGQGSRHRLAQIEAWLGNEKAALELTRQALALLPPEKDAANGAIGLGDAANTYAVLGRVDLLLPVLERIRALPGTDLQTSAATLRLDPIWDKVRKDPRFQAEIPLFAAKEKAFPP